MTDCTDNQKAWICEHVMTTLSGADPVHVERVFLRVFEEFLLKSGAWYVNEWKPIETDGQVSLDFSEQGGQLAWFYVIANITGRGMVHTDAPYGEFRKINGQEPLYYSNTPYPDVLLVHPVPTQEDKMKVYIRAALTFSTCEGDDKTIPDWLFDRYKHGVSKGVQGEMMLELGKPYTNITVGRLRAAEFRHTIAEARDQARRAMGMTESKWRFPRAFIPRPSTFGGTTW